MPEVVITPPVKWAQRKTVVYLTVLVADCKNPTIDISPEKISLAGCTDGKNYKLSFELFKEIDQEQSQHVVRERSIDFVLKKKDQDGPFWKRLLKSDTKVHWLKVDFDKWKDEDDSEDENDTGKDDMDMDIMGNGMPTDFDDFDEESDVEEPNDEENEDKELSGDLSAKSDVVKEGTKKEDNENLEKTKEEVTESS